VVELWLIYIEANKKMTQTQITDAMLFRFFAGQLTEEETARLTAWMDENPKEHQKAMNKAHDIYIESVNGQIK